MTDGETELVCDGSRKGCLGKANLCTSVLTPAKSTRITTRSNAPAAKTVRESAAMTSNRNQQEKGDERRPN